MSRSATPGESDLDQFPFIKEDAIGVFGKFSVHLSDARSVWDSTGPQVRATPGRQRSTFLDEDDLYPTARRRTLHLNVTISFRPDDHELIGSAQRGERLRSV